MELTKEKVLKAAKNNPCAENVLKELFHEYFEPVEEAQKIIDEYKNTAYRGISYIHHNNVPSLSIPLPNANTEVSLNAFQTAIDIVKKRPSVYKIRHEEDAIIIRLRSPL